MRVIGNLFIGAAGTVAAIELKDGAAIFAGLATGVWMLTQAALAVRRDIFPPKK